MTELRRHVMNRAASERQREKVDLAMHLAATALHTEQRVWPRTEQRARGEVRKYPSSRPECGLRDKMQPPHSETSEKAVV